MTLTGRATPNNSPGYASSRRRSGIMPFVAVIGALMLVLLLGTAVVMLMKYKNNNNNNNNTNTSKVNLENNRQLVGTVEIMLLTKEFATMINADSDHQIIKNNSNNSNNNTLANLQSEIHSQTQQHIYEVKSNAEITHNNITAIHSNKNDLPSASARAQAQRKRLHDDGINISNQRYEFNERPPAAKAASVASSAVNNPVSTMYGIPAALQDRQGNDTVYKLPLQQQEEKEAKIEYKKTPANTELLLHRQKRYLVFPEGSSFQMVFDLIIGVVDYTNYAILGITCAVAWELPSKPPSELIENLHEKVTEGIYQTSATKPPTTATATAAMRRNDSITATDGGDGGGDNSKYGIDSAGITYVDNANVAAQVGSNYGADALQMKVETAQLPSPINTLESAAYYTKPNPFVAPPASYSGYSKGTGELNTHDSTAYGAYRPTNYYTNIPHSNYNNNNMDNNSYGRVTDKYGFADKNEKSSYYDVSNSYGRNNNHDKRPFGDSRDKLPVKFANRWQQQQQQQQQSPYKKWQSWQDYDSNSWHSYQQPQQQQQQQQQKQATKWAHQPQKQQKWSAQSKYVGKDNWWSSNNKHYATDNWRTKPGDWQANNVRNHEPPMQPRHPAVAYAPPSETTQATINSKSDAFEGRSFDKSQRSILTARPKARIYPVFGRRRRRRRRRSSDTKLHDFEHKLERIHLREQLRTRQKLYGKIEKLYETRGLNGTACVLRALCETGQQHKGGRAEPQSFITELLRAIFVLPTTNSNHVSDTVSFEEPALHPTDLHIVDRPYREAPAHRGSCSQLFAMCEHSIWE